MEQNNRKKQIALIGATGNIGSRILVEAVDRGYQVSAISRNPEKVQEQAESVIPVMADTHNVDSLTKAISNHDWVVIAVRWSDNDISQVIKAIKQSATRRALFVVGAGSLLWEDGRTYLDYRSTTDKPLGPTSKPALEALEEIRKIREFDWTAISPPAVIAPGQRTGKFRLGTDHLIQDAEGQSCISIEDFAIAIMNEVEKPEHLGGRFTVAY
jgi:putative NADH-flavin reductase